MAARLVKLYLKEWWMIFDLRFYPRKLCWVGILISRQLILQATQNCQPLIVSHLQQNKRPLFVIILLLCHQLPSMSNYSAGHPQTIDFIKMISVSTLQQIKGLLINSWSYHIIPWFWQLPNFYDLTLLRSGTLMSIFKDEYMTGQLKIIVTGAIHSN